MVSNVHVHQLTVMNTCNRPMGVHLIEVFTVQIQT